jgi:transcription initiation factor TFIID subunit 11
VKRRKPPIMSVNSANNAHPLRQTSFPPDGTDVGMRSPSVDTMSIVSGSVVGKKKRGRKPKNADDASISGGKALTVVSGRSGTGGKRALSPDDEDDIGDGTEVAVVTRTKEEKEKEKQHRAMLVENFDPQQFSRYECWRSSRLSDQVVRRLINQTLSQSVPASIILAVKSVTKIYAGEIIERARKVQSQWIESQGGLMSPPAENDELRGPLTAEHLREALRRYKLEREGGFVGLLNLGRQEFAIGGERFGLKAMGRRLLR